MAGLGLKNFASEVLTSADVDGYLAQQVIAVFASEAARDAAYTAQSITPAAGMFCTTTDTGSLWRHNGTAWTPVNTPWVDYTPAWTNLTPGNGTVVAKARYQAGDLRLRGIITWGTTTSASGVIYQTIPYSKTADAAGGSGIGALNDTGTRIYPMTIDIAGSDTAINWFHPETGGTLTGTSPVTLATGDSIRWDITVPVA